MASRLLILGAVACGVVVLLLALNVLSYNENDGLNQFFLNSENSINKNNRIILAATTINDTRRNSMVGGYSSSSTLMDSNNLPEITNVVDFLRTELLAMESPQTVTSSKEETKETTTLYNTIVRQIKEAAQQQNANANNNNTIKMEVLKVQRQVVAGMNYKLTLAIMNTSSSNSNNSKEELNNNNNNEETTTSCLGGIENIIIYKPLPHTGLPYRLVSWGTVLNCDTVLSMIDERSSSSSSVVEETLKQKKNEDEEKAMMVEGEIIQQEEESVEPIA